jgi:hypothetical protein
VIRLQTFIRARYAAHLYNSLYQQLPIQQTRPSIKEVTHYNGFECWTTIDYRNRFTCIQQSSYLDKTDNKIMDFRNHATKHITITVVGEYAYGLPRFRGSKLGHGLQLSDTEC